MELTSTGPISVSAEFIKTSFGQSLQIIGQDSAAYEANAFRCRRIHHEESEEDDDVRQSVC